MNEHYSDRVTPSSTTPVQELILGRTSYMDPMETTVAPDQHEQQAQELQQNDSPETDDQPVVQDSVDSGSLDPAGSQPNHEIVPDHEPEHGDLPLQGWAGDGFIGPTLDQLANWNIVTQNAAVQGTLGLPSEAVAEGHEPPLHPQFRWPAYQVPGNQGYPFMLESNVRNVHAHEYILALSVERMGYLNRAHIHNLWHFLESGITTIKASDLNGDQLDLQGIPWAAIGIRRDEARRHRMNTYINYTNITGADKFKSPEDKTLNTHRNFFRFRWTNTLRDTRLAHFQLRNLLACPNRTQAFYPTIGGLLCMNPLTGFISPALRIAPMASFSCIAADYGVVMAGALNGSYSIRRLDGKIEDAVEGSITRAVGGGANHLDMFTSRGSSSPHVGICSNDSHFRVMDLRTQKMLSSWESDGPFNCSAVSKDGQMRVMMGDLRPVVICDATSGVRIHTLTGHRDYGFACAWSDDGWTLATGNQDKRVCIWDARKWSDSSGYNTPVITIKSEMASVRSLTYSPMGSGKPVLVAAEDADFINIIDAQTYNSKQTIDLFGNIGGVAFTNEGRDLNVLCCDPTRGSLMQFERCGQEVEPLLENMYEDAQNIDLSGGRDLRAMAHKETPYFDLVEHHVDAF